MQKQVAGAKIIIDAPVESVWHAITKSEIGLMPHTVVTSDWNIGDPIVFEGEFFGNHFRDYGEVLERHDGHTVAFSHWSRTAERPDNYHIVRYELDGENGETHVTLTQTNVGEKPEIDAKTKAEFDRNWQMMLAHLKKAAEAGG